MCDGLDNDCDGKTDEMITDENPPCGHCNGFPNDDGLTADVCMVPMGSYTIGPLDAAETVPLMQPYYLDRFEVTNARYFVFLEEQENPELFRPTCQVGDRSWNISAPYFPAELAEHPVVCVTHMQAEAFCEWAGKTLPEAMVWEAAARGLDGRSYPWGEESPLGKANCANDSCHDLYGLNTCPLSSGQRNQCDDTAPVLEFSDEPSLSDGAGPFGHYHLAGNVSEWMKETSEGMLGTVRGGNWNDYWDTASKPLYPYSFQEVQTNYAKMTVGFRCALSFRQLAEVASNAEKDITLSMIP
jgi:formylglycine-generating enzyme required for sulfatase activity